MVKRRKQEDIAGVLEFEGRTSEDPEIVAWLAEHKARKGGKVRVSQGGTGVRVMFSEAADMTAWKARAERAAQGKEPSAS
jgi:erythromycin esterase-like protein